MKIFDYYISGWWLIGLATAIFFVVLCLILKKMCKNAKEINYGD